MYNDVMLYRFKNGAFEEIRDVIIRTKLVSKIAVRDICNESDDDKKKIVSDIIAAEYRTTSDRPVHAYIIKYEPDVYLSVISCRHSDDGIDDEIIKKIYGARNKINVFLSYQTDEAVSVSRTYWKKLLSKLDYSNPIVAESAKGSKTRQKELFVLGESLPYLINVVAQKEKISLKALFTSVWGIVMCHSLERKFVLVEDIHEKGKLRHYPILVPSLTDFKEIYKSVVRQIDGADRFDNVDIETTSKLYKLPIRGMIPIAQNFAGMTHEKIVITEIREEVVYVYEHYPELFAPLCVNYHFGSDSLSVEYEYEENAFEGMDIGRLHESFCVLVTQILSASGSADIRVLKDKADRKANQIRQTASKCDILRDCSLFAGYSLDDLCRIAEKSKFATAVGEELVSDHYSEPGGLYVVGLGKISMEATDNDSLIHPMMLLKRGDCFGLETFTGEKNNIYGYRAVGGIAEVVSIPPHVVEEIEAVDPAFTDKMKKVRDARIEKFGKIRSNT
ncbi:MAG: hypothetical protein K6F44_02745 [Lachnospiraceae bacterium]|nr:hypothetical protein [Lachnospiraceae bacterium]